MVMTLFRWFPKQSDADHEITESFTNLDLESHDVDDSSPTNSPQSSYAASAYRRDTIPEQPAPEKTTRFSKIVEGVGFIERLPWGDYANLDVSVYPETARIHQERMNGKGKVHIAGPAWTHEYQPAEFIKTRWQLLS